MTPSTRFGEVLVDSGFILNYLRRRKYERNLHQSYLAIGRYKRPAVVMPGATDGASFGAVGTVKKTCPSMAPAAL